MESFFGSMQLEMPGTRSWAIREGLANVIFEWIEAWYKLRRHHSAPGYHSPIEYEAIHNTADQPAT